MAYCNNKSKCSSLPPIYFKISIFSVVLLVFSLVPVLPSEVPPLKTGRQLKLLRRFEISKKTCTGKIGKEKDIPGMCMFNFQCHQKGGEVIGTCIDGFLFGACCRLPPEVLEMLLKMEAPTESPIALLNELHTTYKSIKPIERKPILTSKPSVQSNIFGISQSDLVTKNSLTFKRKTKPDASQNTNNKISEDYFIQTNNQLDGINQIIRNISTVILKENDTITTQSPKRIISSTIFNKLINDLLLSNNTATRRTMLASLSATTSVPQELTSKKNINKMNRIPVTTYRNSSTQEVKNNSLHNTKKGLKSQMMHNNSLIAKNTIKHTSSNKVKKPTLHKKSDSSIKKSEVNFAHKKSASKPIKHKNTNNTLKNSLVSKSKRPLPHTVAHTPNTTDRSKTTRPYLQKNSQRPFTKKGIVNKNKKRVTTLKPTTMEKTTSKKEAMITSDKVTSKTRPTIPIRVTHSPLNKLSAVKSTPKSQEPSPLPSDPMATWTTKNPLSKITRPTRIPSVPPPPLNTTEINKNVPSLELTTEIYIKEQPTSSEKTSSSDNDFDLDITTESLLFWTTRNPVVNPLVHTKNQSAASYIIIKNGTLTQSPLLPKKNESMAIISNFKPPSVIYETVLQQIATNLLKNDDSKNKSSNGASASYPLLSLSYDVVKNSTVPVLNSSNNTGNYVKVIPLYNSSHTEHDKIQTQINDNSNDKLSVTSGYDSELSASLTKIGTLLRINASEESTPANEVKPKPPLDMGLLMQLLNLTSYIPEAGIFIPPHLLTTTINPFGNVIPTQPFKNNMSTNFTTKLTTYAEITTKKTSNPSKNSTQTHKVDTNELKVTSQDVKQNLTIYNNLVSSLPGNFTIYNNTSSHSGNSTVHNNTTESLAVNSTAHNNTSAILPENSTAPSEDPSSNHENSTDTLEQDISTTIFPENLTRLIGNKTDLLKSESSPTTTTSTTTTRKKWDWRKTCGVRPLVREGRIVNGKRSDFGEWPWQALVRESTWLGIFTKNKCGGVLLNEKYVLTAAHCQPGFLASLIVVLGELDVSGEYEPKRTIKRKVKRVVVHKDFVAKTFDNDLALLELEKPIKFDEHILPICLPSDDSESFVGKKGFVSGWGRLSYQGTIPNLLHNVEVPVIPNRRCQKWFRESGHSKEIKPEFICAGYKNGKMDSCEGDSGGPLSIPGPDGRWILAGIVSHGIKCAFPKLPGVYMRMTYYKPWIEKVINS